MSLHELMGWPGPMTHLQFEAWQEWLDGEQYQWPSLTDQYLMRVAQRVDQVLMTKDRDSVTLNHELIAAEDLQREGRTRADDEDDEEYTEEELKQLTRDMKAVWGARLNIKIPD